MQKLSATTDLHDDVNIFSICMLTGTKTNTSRDRVQVVEMQDMDGSRILPKSSTATASMPDKKRDKEFLSNSSQHVVHVQDMKGSRVLLKFSTASGSTAVTNHS